jgi:L-alanine-DL-glutamate epimerase-like enolase superfamily enzyme
MAEIWQTVALLESAAGHRGIGLCSQGVLWSDARVFAGHSESGGNALMYAMTERALQMLKGQSFDDPITLLESIRHEVFAYGKKITGNPALRETFALNALVAVDFAVWLLYARERGIVRFDDLIPAAYRPALAARHAQVAAIPLAAYAIPVDEIRAMTEAGSFFIKIKLGQPGTQAEMLEKDIARLTALHAAIGHARTPHTADGRLPYYFDANGRYESKETLLRLLDHARAIGAFGQIALVEEPFPEELETDVRDIPVRLAADESAHTDRDARARIDMGYGAIALKPIAKTFSMSLKIAQLAHERGVPCFCADLTVNPLLVEWNKAVAARLAPFPGLKIGLVETNGHQNYRNWETLRRRHPAPDAPWARVQGGVFELGADYYAQSGGLFAPLPHYEAMFPR